MCVMMVEGKVLLEMYEREKYEERLLFIAKTASVRSEGGDQSAHDDDVRFLFF